MNAKVIAGGVMICAVFGGLLMVPGVTLPVHVWAHGALFGAAVVLYAQGCLEDHRAGRDPRKENV